MNKLYQSLPSPTKLERQGLPAIRSQAGVRLNDETNVDLEKTDDEFIKQTVEVLNELKEGIEMRKREEESG